MNLAANLSHNGTLSPGIAAVVMRLQASIEHHANRSYPYDIDHSNFSTDQYCDIVKRDKWVKPFGYAPPPAPTPPPAPIPGSVATLLTGTWRQQNFERFEMTVDQQRSAATEPASSSAEQPLSR